MKLKLTVDGKLYEVEVEVDEPQSPRPGYVPPPGHARAPAGAAPAPEQATGGKEVVADESKVCRSPVAGVVVRVTAQVGQEISASDSLMVVEAMETEITSPKSGKVAKINASPGDSVKTGQVLVELE